MEPLSKHNLENVDFSSEKSLLEYAKKLEGHTFREVLDLGILPPGGGGRYDADEYKGGMGVLVEERYFGYKANSSPEPDFEDAGVELKTTCLDRRKNGSEKAGERLVIAMIGYDRTIEVEFSASHAWAKASRILLVYYERDKSLASKCDYRVRHVALFTPPPVDAAMMEQDYRTIQKYVTEGRADELSESLTNYLGACTKGSGESKFRDQKIYAPGRIARSRAWSLKQSYMNVVLRDYILGDAGGESIVKDPSELDGTGFDDLVLGKVAAHAGMEDSDIAEKLGMTAGPGNKSFWKMIAYRLLGLGGENAAEFEKAGVKVRTVRVEARGKIKESFPLATFEFKALADEDEWEESELYRYFDETRYFFVVFEQSEAGYRLKGARFWSMPREDLDGALRECWEAARDKVRRGVTFTKKVRADGKVVVCNDLPGIDDNPVAHVRPHTSRSAYKLADGYERGDLERDGDELPDGQWMTKQSFWLKNDYIYGFLKDV